MLTLEVWPLPSQSLSRIWDGVTNVFSIRTPKSVWEWDSFLLVGRRDSKPKPVTWSRSRYYHAHAVTEGVALPICKGHWEVWSSFYRRGRKEPGMGQVDGTLCCSNQRKCTCSQLLVGVEKHKNENRQKLKGGWCDNFFCRNIKSKSCIYSIAMIETFFIVWFSVK